MLADMSSGSSVRVRRTHSTDLDQHVGLIKQQVDRSLRDGDSRQLAVKIVSGKYDMVKTRRTGEEVPTIRAYGKTFLVSPSEVCRMRDDMCEVERIWDFVVLNIRYVYDPTDIDTFATLRESLQAGGGDCDDLTTAFATLLGCIGFHVGARVISIDPKSPQSWAHIYPMVGLSKDTAEKWVPLDASVDGAVPGWEFDKIVQHRDYKLI